jgi:FKBP-type peptidyl-prolyl cis-trans isomerase FkpA
MKVLVPAKLWTLYQSLRITMKFKLPLVAAFVAVLGLTACGGSSSDTGAGTAVSSPATLTKTDTVVGTGADAVAGKTVSVNYTGWLYNSSAANLKGAQFDSSAGKAPLQFTVGAGTVIAGFDQGVTGMKVGGKRTILIPTSLGYGALGTNGIPPNSGLVFEVELIAVN